MALYWLVGLFVFVIFKFCFFSGSKQIRILDVYTVPGKWYHLKFLIVYLVISIRKLTARLWIDKRKLNPGYGIATHDCLDDMDKKQPLSKDPKAFDAVYLNGASRTGWYLVVGLAHRPSNVDGFMILKVPGVGLLLSPKIPDGVLSKDESEVDSYSSEGLSVTPIQPMRAWKLQYNGKMRLAQNPKKKVNVVLNVTWRSKLRPFNYDTDILTKNIAKALSAEVWTPNYFKMLKNYHQTHYEQFGEMTGELVIDNIQFNINMNAMRDHSFGMRREWKGVHRYVLHVFTVANGICGNVGVVCMPNIFARLEIGYVYGKDGLLDAARDLDFELYQHGENGIPPTDYGLTFYAGKKQYEMKVHVEETTEIYLGLEWEVRIVESLCRYTVNGVEGWGVVEWGYRHCGGRANPIIRHTQQKQKPAFD